MRQDNSRFVTKQRNDGKGLNMDDERPFRIAVAVHGGVGNPTPSEECVAAAQAGLDRLHGGEDALAAAIAAVVVLEDNPHFNAGTGSCLALDGETIELDAAIMDSGGRLGAVACLTKTKNPVLVARAVADTPHHFLAGEGATRFARLAGFIEHEVVTEQACRAHRRVLAELNDPSTREFMPGKPNELYQRYWNFALPWDEALLRYGSGTVGAVAVDGQGRLAVATSTGGSTPMLLGRVGDTPLPGCGYYAGPAGAIACTGIGEFILHRLLAYRVYREIEAGKPLRDALDEALDAFPDEVPVGLIGATRDEIAVASNEPIPAWVLHE